MRIVWCNRAKHHGPYPSKYSGEKLMVTIDLNSSGAYINWIPPINESDIVILYNRKYVYRKNGLYRIEMNEHG